MRRLEGKIAVITGGAGGLGAAVVVADIAEARAREVAERIGGGSVGLHFDCGDPASI